MFGQTGSKPVLQSLLVLFLSKKVYSSSHTHPLTSHFLTPADPSTPMCVTQGGDSGRWCCRHGGTEAISICLCPPAFSPLCLSLSLPLWPLQPVAMWPIDPWLDWSLTAIKALSYFTMTATGQYDLDILKIEQGRSLKHIQAGCSDFIALLF